MILPRRLLALLLLALLGALVAGQEKSVRPGINKRFEDPDVPAFIDAFEKNGREIYDYRKEIVQACKIKPGMVVADIGAGTGLFTRLFAPAVGDRLRIVAGHVHQNWLEVCPDKERDMATCPDCNYCPYFGQGTAGEASEVFENLALRFLQERDTPEKLNIGDIAEEEIDAFCRKVYGG